VFVTLEGGEGAGKSTQARLLAERLSREGFPVLLTREPGGSPGAEALRALLLRRSLPQAGGWSSLAETLLHFAARAEHVARTLRPALNAGLVVVCDRFTDSTIAYQGYGQGADQASIGQLAGLIALRPDLTLVLTLSREEARRRIAGRAAPRDRYEALDEAFHARVAQGYRLIAAAEPDRCVEVAAGGGVEAVAALIWDAVRARLPRASQERA
jgi:dTMP kinase